MNFKIVNSRHRDVIGLLIAFEITLLLGILLIVNVSNFVLLAAFDGYKVE